METLESYCSPTAVDALKDDLTHTIFEDPVIVAVSGRTVSRKLVIQRESKYFDPYSQQETTVCFLVVLVFVVLCRRYLALVNLLILGNPQYHTKREDRKLHGRHY